MGKPLDTRRWLWRAMIKTSLIPLALAGVGLIGIYVVTYKLMYEHQVALLEEESSKLLSQVLERESRLMKADLKGWERQVELLADAAGRALHAPVGKARVVEELDRHRREPSGVYHAPFDDGRAASYYSALTPPAMQDQRKIAQLASLDPLMKGLVEGDTRVRQVYINTFDSYNRLWPWFDAQGTYDSHIDIPSFNFYFLADARHNPARRPVWTDAYVDPAGSGWMISAVAPVYSDRFLEAVAGLDITLEELIDRLLAVELPWSGYAMLIDGDGTLLAIPPAGQRDFDLMARGAAADTTPHKARFSPRHFDLLQWSDDPVFNEVLAEQRGSVRTRLGGEPRLLAWHELEEVDWKLMAVIDETSAFVTGDSLGRAFRELGLWMVTGLLLFCLVTLAIIRQRSHALTRMLVAPLHRLQAMAADIGARRAVNKPSFRLSEFNEVGDALVNASQEREGALAALAAEKERLRLALDASGGAVWEYDILNDRLTMHESVFHMLGLEPVAAIPLASFQALIHPDDLPSFESQRRRAVAKKIAVGEIEMRLRLPDGRWLWVLTRGSVLRRDEAGEALYATGVVLNIHHRKRASAELERARDDASWAQHAQSRLFSRVSHELRTPLGVILGYTDLLQDSDKSRLDEQARVYLVEVARAAERLDELLEDMLQLASLESGELTIECTPQSALRCLRRNARQLSVRALRSGVQLEVDASATSTWLLGDRQRLDQVLQNLIVNAIKYNRPGGWIRLSAWAETDGVCLEVADSGQGIAEESRAELFQPFSRLGMEHSDIRGSGLGLALSMELVRRMQGRIEVVSRPGQGSRFQVWLPRVDVQVHQSAVNRALPVEARLERPLTMLLVCSDEETRIRMEVLAEHLATLTLSSTRRQARALRLVNEQPPDLLVCGTPLELHQAAELLRRCRRLKGDPAVQGYWIGPPPLPEGFKQHWQQPPRMEDVWAALQQVGSVTSGDEP